jgi:hypothetical protein
MKTQEIIFNFLGVLAVVLFVVGCLFVTRLFGVQSLRDECEVDAPMETIHCREKTQQGRGK